MFGSLVDYWWITGDESYTKIISQALLHQKGKNDFMSENETLSEGNDDQGFWAMAAMQAAEHKFPDPPEDEPQWLALVQAVFNQYVSRWDDTNCDGGLRWQIFEWNAGFDYKNSISNGCFFNIASRLARYTGNTTFSDWAEKIWDWEVGQGIITDKWQVYDGIHFSDQKKCPTNLDQIQWSYNAGIFMYGAATMYNITESDTWKERVDGLISDIETRFVKNDVLYEQYCEPTKQCNQDQQSFKGYLLRWMAATTMVAPHTYDKLYALILSSAQKAAATCTGTPDATAFKGHAGTACGFTWVNGAFDNQVGVAPQMNALQAIIYTMVSNASALVTAKTGGTSKGDNNGGNEDEKSNKPEFRTITTADKAGAGVFTTLVLAGLLLGVAFIAI